MSKLSFDEEAFARMLEGAAAPRTLDERRMGALAAALHSAATNPSPAPPRPAFATALREQLLAQAAVVVEAQKAARIPLNERFVIALRAKNEAWRRSFRAVAATGMAAALTLGSSAALASAHNALPGQWNYGVKRTQEGVRLTFARGDLAKGTVHMDLARRRLAELRALADANVSDQRLYVDTLNDMDSSTLLATESIVDAVRAGAPRSALDRLSRFASAQQGRLAGMVDEIPAGARPAAEDSLGVLGKVHSRVSAILAGCPCPGNPREIPTLTARANPEVGCSCLQPGGSSDPSRASGSTRDPAATGTTSPSPSPSPSTSAGTDLVPGTDVDDPANDAVDSVDDVLEDLGLPRVTPSGV